MPSALDAKTLYELVAAFRESGLAAPLQDYDDNDALAGLAAPAAVALWIRRFHPELAARRSLCLAVVGAVGADSVDDGRWYQYLPWLLDAPELEVSVHLVGPELISAIDENAPSRTPRGTVATDIFERLPAFRNAFLYACPVSEFLRQTSAEFDLFFAFNPDLLRSFEEWTDEKELPALCARGVPLAVTSNSEERMHADTWALKTLGYTVYAPLGSGLWRNPFEVLTPEGAWAGYLWEITRGPEPGFVPNDEAMREFHMFSQLSRYYSQRIGTQFPLYAGRLIMLAHERDDELRLHEVVLMPMENVGVMLETGELVRLEPGVARSLATLPPPLPSSYLKTYPRHTRFGFEHMLWAMKGIIDLALDAKAADKEGTGEDRDEFRMSDMFDMLRDLNRLRREMADPESPEASDTRLFPLSDDELKQGMADLIKQATGETVDPDAFMEQMRVSGGLNGVPRELWRDFLGDHLGWDVTDLERDDRRFAPAFWAGTRDGGIELPVIVEGYVYAPGDQEDELANEAFDVLAARHPKGCLLLFGQLCFKHIEGRAYTFGGMLYRNQVWAPFALSEAMDSFDALLEQRYLGFSFGSPLEEYEDADGHLAMGFNAYAAGHDPSKGVEMVTLRFGDWMYPRPNQMGRPD